MSLSISLLPSNTLKSSFVELVERSAATMPIVSDGLYSAENESFFHSDWIVIALLRNISRSEAVSVEISRDANSIDDVNNSRRMEIVFFMSFTFVAFCFDVNSLFQYFQKRNDTLRRLH